jgi:deoxyribose-phosphate aldolase
MRDRYERAVQIVSLLDLTSLSGGESVADIDALCAKASGPLGHVAALCVFPRHLPRVLENLARMGLAGVEAATVANFPAGRLDPAAAMGEIRAAVGLGATEIDLVLPFAAFLEGRETAVGDFLATCRAACPVRLKVILESGVLARPEVIRAASRLALDCGADFLKTSTGKAAVHATPEAARVMLETIAERGGEAGFKASGGLRTMADALVYLELAEDILGSGWVGPRTFRFGASGLLDDVLAVAAGGGAACAAPA